MKNAIIELRHKNGAILYKIDAYTLMFLHVGSQYASVRAVHTLSSLLPAVNFNDIDVYVDDVLQTPFASELVTDNRQFPIPDRPDWIERKVDAFFRMCDKLLDRYFYKKH